MKKITANLNFSLDLSQSADMQITQFQYALTQFANAGIEIDFCANVARSIGGSAERVNRDIGPNEAAVLEHSGKTRMRCPSGVSDREAYAAELLNSKYGMLPKVAVDVESSESSDEDDADLM